VEPRELELGLGLDAERAHDGHPGSLGNGVFEQGRLADPGLAAQQQRAAVLAARPLEHRLDALALALTANQHRPTLTTPGCED
jgi:hypothetical protein